MFTRITAAIIFGLALTGDACAQDTAGAAQPRPQIDPTRAALAQMLQEAQAREAGALARAYEMRVQLDAATKRADEAEAKVKAEAAPKDEPAKP